MRRKNVIPVMIVLLLSISQIVSAQENVTIVAPTSEIAEGLDLHAVAELFKDAENLEEFEDALNNPEYGINNLDLDGDGYVDYIRVVEQVSDYTHVIILQVPLGEDDFQDVATIEVEKTGDEAYNMQVHGNEIIYGPDYYVAPVYVHIHRWHIIPWLFRPFYRPYVSVYYYGYYPRWWNPYPMVQINIYRTRTVHYTSRASFQVTYVSHVKTVHKVNYKPRTSVRVEQRVHEVRSAPAPNRVERTSRQNRIETNATSLNRRDVRTERRVIDTKASMDAKKVNSSIDKRKIRDKNEALKKTNPRVRKTTAVKSNMKKPTRSDVKRSRAIKSHSRKTTRPAMNKSSRIRIDARKATTPKMKKSATRRSNISKASKPKVNRSKSISSSRKPTKPKAQKKPAPKKSSKNSKRVKKNL